MGTTAPLATLQPSAPSLTNQYAGNTYMPRSSPKHSPNFDSDIAMSVIQVGEIDLDIVRCTLSGKRHPVSRRRRLTATNVRPSSTPTSPTAAIHGLAPVAGMF